MINLGFIVLNKSNLYEELEKFIYEAMHHLQTECQSSGGVNLFIGLRLYEIAAKNFSNS